LKSFGLNNLDSLDIGVGKVNAGIKPVKRVVPPIEFRVKASKPYAIYYFENLDLYVKVKTETTQPGYQPSKSALMKVARDFVKKIFDAFEVF